VPKIATFPLQPSTEHERIYMFT